MGYFGDYDRILRDDEVSFSFDPVVARPVAAVQVPPTVQQQFHVVPVREECKFCKNNGKAEAVYTSHSFKDNKGNCACPILRQYRCPTCNATGDKAHTIKYCPKKKVYTVEDTLKMQKRRQFQL